MVCGIPQKNFFFLFFWVLGFFGGRGGWLKVKSNFPEIVGRVVREGGSEGGSEGSEGGGGGGIRVRKTGTWSCCLLMREEKRKKKKEKKQQRRRRERKKGVAMDGVR